MSAYAVEELWAVASRAMATPHEVLTLRLDGKEYGINILCVQEIRSYERPARRVGAPPHVLGVTKLRGVIVPLVDLRGCLGLDAAYNSSTVTVVLGMGGRTVGAVVDSVSDVLALRPDQVKPAPEVSGTVDASHVTGIATVGEGEHARRLTLLDIAALFSAADLAPSSQVTQ